MAVSVRDLCRQKGVSLLELADRAALDLPRARAIYQGRWTPTPAEREAIAASLDVSMDEIAWGHQTPIQHIYGYGPG